MKANKVTLKIEIETLSVNSLAGCLIDALNQIQDEIYSGVLVAEDGDSTSWNITLQPVDF